MFPLVLLGLTRQFQLSIGWEGEMGNGSIEEPANRLRLGALIASEEPVCSSSTMEALRIRKREPLFATDVSNLFHYTTIAGFQGIISSGGLWASDSRFMNDAEEMLDGRRLASEVLKYSIRRARCSGFGQILEEVCDHFSGPPTEANFVACLSTTRDNLTQWRAYGAEGGVCIGFKNGPGGADYLFNSPQASPYRVIYGLRRKRTLLLSVIRRFCRQYQIDHDHYGNDQAIVGKHLYLSEIKGVIAQHITAFKNESFSSEAEVRIIISANMAHIFGELAFRPSKVGLIPYVNTSGRLPEGQKLPLTEVIVGPSAHQDLVAKSVTTFLAAKGYSAVPVMKSVVPLRAL